MKVFNARKELRWQKINFPEPEFSSPCQPTALALALDIPLGKAALLLAEFGWSGRNPDNEITAVLNLLNWRLYELPMEKRRATKFFAPKRGVILTEGHVAYAQGGVLMDVLDSRDHAVEGFLLPPKGK